MFTDRKDAAEKLARALEKYRNQPVLVLGIPRGGVETAFYVARYLNAELSLVVARKLGYPLNPEAAFGAVAEDGSLYLAEGAEQDLTPEEITAIVTREKQEIQRRIQTFRHGKPLPDLNGKTVMVVDDGIATGATLFAVLELCRNKKAGKIVVAAPIASREMDSRLRRIADDVVILDTPRSYTAVSQGYLSFDNLSDEETIAFMDTWRKEHPVKV